MKHCLLLILLSLTWLSTSQAAVIYTQTFGGTGSALNGTAATTSATFAGGTAGATWSASTLYSTSGAVSAGSGSAMLPLAVQSGFIYTLTGSVSPINATGWISLGFAQSLNTGNNHFGNGGSAWMLQHGGGSVQTASAGNTGIETESTVGKPANFTIVLNTSGASWTAEWFLNGISQRTHTYTTNPTINWVGYGSASGISGTVGDFTLSAVAVPEPSRILLLIGGLTLVTLPRRKKACLSHLRP